MKVNYDGRTDTLTLVLKEAADIADSDEAKPGFILDFDAEGDLVGIEVLDASKRVTNARRVDFEETVS